MRHGWGVFALLLCCLLPGPVLARDKGPDTVDVYLVPLDDFPEAVASSMARFLSDDMKLWAKATLRLPPADYARLPGSNQLAGEDVIARVQPQLRALPEAADNTYFMLLTARDINSAAAGQRFQFSLHNSATRTSLVSLARLFKYEGGRPVVDEQVQMRLYKMTKRAIGEMHLGWKRSGDRDDIMYSPLMSLNDLDSIGLGHGNDPLPSAAQRVPEPQTF